jgi:outer membrane autotransporter barrel domain
MHQKNQTDYVRHPIQQTLRAGIVSAIATGLALSSSGVNAGTCSFDSNVICRGDTTLTGGSYDSVSIDNSESGATLTLNNVTITGQGGLIDGKGYIYGGSGDNHLILNNNTAAEVAGGNTIDIYGGHYGRVLGGAGDSVVSIHGDSAYIGALSGGFLIDPGGNTDTTGNHNILNLITVTDAIAINPLSQTTIPPDQSTDFQGGASVWGFKEVNLVDHSDLTLRNDLWNGGKAQSPVLSVDKTSRLNVTGRQTVFGSISNGGTVNLHTGSPGNQLHVTENWYGNGGILQLGTRLEDDASPTDSLVIDGNTYGTTNVVITHAGGSGNQTLKGIKVISVGGTSEGQFVQRGRIVAGAYDYSLARGTGDNAANWYLTSELTPVDGGDDPLPPENNVRPEAAAYGVNAAAANTLFTTSLHDRLGETRYVDTDGNTQITSLWMRHVGGHNRSTDSSGQNKTQANRYVVQLGGDIASGSHNGQDRLHFGLMGGYANQHSNTHNTHTGYSAKGQIDGYSTGLYVTWLQDDTNNTGAYVDTWILYNWFDNSVNGQGAPAENYKSKGLTASIETGYAWQLAELSERSSWYIMPQAQLTYQGVKADDHHEFNGSTISSEGDGNLQSRLGVRTYLKGYSALDNGSGRIFEPFLEASWLHNTHRFGASLNDVRIDQAGARNIGELKAGVEAKLSQTIHLWGSVAQQMGDKGYSDTQAILGLKVNF